MRSIKDLGWGGANLNQNLKPAIDELQNLRIVLATGAAANTAITVAGMVAGDYVLSVVDLTTPANVSLAGLVVGAGSFTITATTATKNLLVQWAPKK